MESHFMLPLQPLEPKLQPSFTRPRDNYAVVINANAGRVTPRLTRTLKELVPKNQLFLTKSQLHARDVIQECVENKVDAVFAGGGDGTIVDVINTLNDFKGTNSKIPAIGILRLGTGNALASWVGSESPVADLAKWKSGKLHKLMPVQLVEAEGALFPFAGLGMDAAILNDYNQIKAAARGKWWQNIAKGIRGYLVAGYTKTLPNLIRRQKARVKIINVGRPAFKINQHGLETGAPIPQGGVIYEGTSTMVCCANTPYYGYKLKLFPFASKRYGRFQLRISDLSIAQCAYNIYKAWNGKINHPKVHDYYVDRVRIIFEDAMPYQFGGEAMGYRKEITFSLSQSPIHMIGQA
jgi:diacylglycerol kinase family enzyme